MNKKKLSTIIIVLLLLIPTLMSKPFDNDSWWLINTGEYIVENGVPTIEPFTIHENLTFYAQQWLFDIIIYFIFNAFGFLGITVFIKLFSILFTFLFYKFFMFSSENNIPVSVIATFFICYFMNSIFIPAGDRRNAS